MVMITVKAILINSIYFMTQNKAKIAQIQLLVANLLFCQTFEILIAVNDKMTASSYFSCKKFLTKCWHASDSKSVGREIGAGNIAACSKLLKLDMKHLF